MRNLGIAHSNLGDVLKAQGDLSGARSSYEQDLSISQRLSDQDPSNTDWLQNLGIAHSNLGHVLKAQAISRAPGHLTSKTCRSLSA